LENYLKNARFRENLVAKREEVAVRVISACKDPGISTVAMLPKPTGKLFTRQKLLENRLHQCWTQGGHPDALIETPARLTGHATECRINADNPNTFWPSPGHITGLNLPDGIGIRADTAGCAGWIVPPHDDSLLAPFSVEPAAAARHEQLVMEASAWSQSQNPRKRRIGMKNVMSGLAKFQDETFPQNRELFERLASGQSPETLFITCSDSRIDPCMLTCTKPGEIFICRNAGNIVPAYGEVIGGVSATIEYAVLALGVKDIILCGHSDCGAMRALLNPQSVAHLPAVSAWLRYGESARLVVQENHSHLSSADLLTEMIEQNVLAQLDNLRTHPAVSARLSKGRLKLHGWAYDIGSGEVRAFDPAQARFAPLQTRTPALA